MGILAHPKGLALLLETVDKIKEPKIKAAELGYMVINGSIAHLTDALKNCSRGLQERFPKEIYLEKNKNYNIPKEIVYKTLFSEVETIDNYIAKNEKTRVTLKHDLNHPIPKRYTETQDIVIDSGTLEHIFNFPQALINISEMLKIGGFIFHFLPANNQLEHGFHQFSAETLLGWYKENGYDIKCAYYSTQDKNLDYYGQNSRNKENFEIIDLLKEGDQLERFLESNRIKKEGLGTEVIVVAQKKASIGQYTYPQQNFWSTHWKKTGIE